jgi:uncharacterized damage-inducible protein DinB
MVRRPAADEHDAYYSLYIDQVPDGDLVRLMDAELDVALGLYAAIPPELESHRYEPGKWSVREVIGHVLDVERLFGYRALSFARRDPGHLPSMDQDQWAADSNAADRPLADLVDEWAHSRRANRAMFASFDEGILSRRGVASGFEFSVRSIGYILVGHEIHHRKVLRERYLVV